MLISSHLLSEIEQIATSVGIISQGKLVFQGSMDQLRGKSEARIALKTANNTEAERIFLNQGLPSLPAGEYLTLKSVGDSEVARINKTLVHAGVDVIRIEEHRKSLEQLFLEMTGKESSL